MISYYENPRMLERQLSNFRDYEPQVRDHVTLILVDDGSPRAPARIESCPVKHKLYRHLVDVRWNQHACRNLGVSQAETEWVVMTDIDHLVPRETAQALVYDKHDAERAYRFSRVLAPGLIRHKPHANSWFMARSLFDRCGGYDERFAGIYGTDSDFGHRLKRRARVQMLQENLVLIPRALVADASTTHYERTLEPDRIRQIVETRGADEPVRLTFPWERVS